MHERQFDWLTHVLPLEKLNIVQLLQQATEPNGAVMAKDDVTPFKMNGDPSTLTDQRIPTRRCECCVRGEGLGSVSQYPAVAAPGKNLRGGKFFDADYS